MKTPAQVMAPKPDSATAKPDSSPARNSQTPQQQTSIPSQPEPEQVIQRPPSQNPPPNQPAPRPKQNIPPGNAVSTIPDQNASHTSGNISGTEKSPTQNATKRSPYPKPDAKKTSATSGPKRKKGIRAELVEKVGDIELVEHIKDYIENSLSAKPISKQEFVRKLVRTGMDTQTALTLIAYAENSDEGKEIALGSAWTTFYYGMAALIGGLLLNGLTIVLAGVIIKFLVAIPIFGFLAVANGGQKILAVNFPVFNNTFFQILLFLIFLIVLGGGFYLALR
jgi:hypothetical protein